MRIDTKEIYFFVKSLQYIKIENHFHKQSEKTWMCF